jgi:hypothetical protein
VALEPYRLDPLKMLQEGHVKVWDPDRGETDFLPWPHQEESIAAWIDIPKLAEGEIQFRNVHIEKSRQEGDTTAFAYAMLWVLTFWPCPLLIQHKDKSAVADSGPTYDSFFGKVKFMWENWPVEYGRAPLQFIGGTAPIIRRSDDPTGFLTGEGQTVDPGRGGRYKGALIDEAARLRWGRQAQAALTRAIPVGRVMLSTPFGEGNVYFELREKRPRGWQFLRHHWTDHPLYSRGLHIAGQKPETCARCASTVRGDRYNPHDPNSAHRFPGKPTSPWYDDAVLELTDEQVAQELDIDYAASLTARVYPEFDSAIHVADVPIPWDPYLQIETYWDYGVHPTAIVICQEGPMEHRVIGEVEVTGLAPESVAAQVDAELRELGVTANEFGVRANWLNIGDPHGKARQIGTGVTLESQYAQHGFSIVSSPAAIRNTIDSVKRLLGGMPKPLLVSPRCEKFIAHIKANRYQVDGQGDRRYDVEAPMNDEHNHMLRAFAYGIHWKWPAPDPEEGIVRATREQDWYEDDSGRIDSGISYDMDF